MGRVVRHYIKVAIRCKIAYFPILAQAGDKGNGTGHACADDKGVADSATQGLGVDGDEIKIIKWSVLWLAWYPRWIVCCDALQGVLVSAFKEGGDEVAQSCS